MDASVAPVDAARDAAMVLGGTLDAQAGDSALGCGDASCADPTPACDPATGRCVACLPDTDRCDPGRYCAADGGYACAPGCKSALDCSPPDAGTGDGGAPAARMECCDHQCVDRGSDPAHCGACGTVCMNASCCDGACTDTGQDVLNCGGCGRACPAAAHAAFACVKSSCRVTGCTAPFLDCNLDPGDGCEADPTSDPSNCGGCGTFCAVPNGLGKCTKGVCGFGSCYKGFGDCDGNLGNGCETQVTLDPKNCGGCGKACTTLPHASAACMGGVCSVTACDMGFADCDGNPANGCESNPLTDKNNCGGCGVACAMVPNGAPGCASGACVIAQCTAPFGDCDKNLGNGCEDDLSSDVSNCGKCGAACAGVANATVACTQGGCGFKACNPGYADCDKSGGNGCEVNLSSDARNCGKCGAACPNGQLCGNGVCFACGNDCWGASGCATAAGHCIQFTCRPGTSNGTFCNACLGWKEVTYQQWMNGGYCQDVFARFRQSDGVTGRCGQQNVGCCHGAGKCGSVDGGWNLWDGAANRNVGPCISCGANTACTFWDAVDASAYARITVCEHP